VALRRRRVDEKVASAVSTSDEDERSREEQREKKRRLGEGEMTENEEGFAFIPRLEMLQVNPTTTNDANQSNNPK
jgi:hypothetical protein